MRIERIDDKTVKCYLSSEELEEYEITYKDFVTRSDKAKEMVAQIIAQAVEEVGYKPPEFAMDMQIMLMPDQGMILTLSEKTPDEIRNNPTLMEYLREMKKIFEQKMAGADMTPDNIEKLLNGGGAEKLLGGQPATAISNHSAGNVCENKVPGQAKKAGSHTSDEEKAGQPGFAVFAFASLRRVCDYVKVLPKTLRVNSCLYAEKGVCYLYMEKGAASYRRYSRACIQALEYGSLFGATMDKVAYLQEHAECLIPEKAIQKLRL